MSALTHCLHGLFSLNCNACSLNSMITGPQLPKQYLCADRRLGECLVGDFRIVDYNECPPSRELCKSFKEYFNSDKIAQQNETRIMFQLISSIYTQICTYSFIGSEVGLFGWQRLNLYPNPLLILTHRVVGVSCNDVMPTGFWVGVFLVVTAVCR